MYTSARSVASSQRTTALRKLPIMRPTPTRRRHRDHQRGDGHRGAAERAGDAPRRHAAERARSAAPAAGAPARTRARPASGAAQGAADDEREQASEADRRCRLTAAGARPRRRAKQGEARRGQPRGGAPGPRLEAGAAPARRAARAPVASSAGRERRQRGWPPRPSAAPLASASPGDARPRAPTTTKYRSLIVRVTSRSSPLAEDDAQAKPRACPSDAHRQAPRPDQREDLAARDAERAQGADQRPALHHRERHGVVDEEHADEQGEQARARSG